MCQLEQCLTIYDYMVTYKPAMLIQNPPAICPNCGSHRTEIVDFSNDRQTVVIRCNACGNRWKIQATLENRLTTMRFFEVDSFRVLNWQHT